MKRALIQQLPYYKTCQACGKSFEVKTRHEPQYCSNACRTIFYVYKKKGLISQEPDLVPKNQAPAPAPPIKTKPITKKVTISKTNPDTEVYTFQSKRECVRKLIEWKTKGHSKVFHSHIGELKTWNLYSTTKGMLTVRETETGFYEATIGQ